MWCLIVEIVHTYKYMISKENTLLSGFFSPLKCTTFSLKQVKIIPLIYLLYKRLSKLQFTIQFISLLAGLVL